MYRRHLLLLVLLVVFCAKTSSRPAAAMRVCGHHLANVLAVVCEGRGYNDPFSQPPASAPIQRTSKRSAEFTSEAKGVADECCRIGCTYKTMEQYCSPNPASANSNSSSASSENSSAGHKWSDILPTRSTLRAIVDQVRGRKRRRGKERCRCRRRRRRRGKRVENSERQEPTTSPTPTFKVGIARQYFDGFFLPHASSSRLKPFNITETRY